MFVKLNLNLGACSLENKKKLYIFLIGKKKKVISPTENTLQSKTCPTSPQSIKPVTIE